MQKKLILLALILTTQPTLAYNLNGKRWVEPTSTIFLPQSLKQPKILKRMRIVRRQYNTETPFKVRMRINDGAFASTLDAIYFAADTNSIVVLYQEGEDYGLGTRVANLSFIASQGGTKVHAAVIRINDIRYKQVTAGGNLNYLANVISHEIGHAYGLDHTDHRIRPRPVMVSGGKFSKLKRLGLAPDDKRGLREIY